MKIKKKRQNLKLEPYNLNLILKQMRYILLKHSKRTFALILTDKASKNGAIICKGYYVEVILKRIGVIGHENKTYCKANESCDELKHENTEYTKCLGFKVTEKQKNHNLCTGFLKCI